MNLLQAIQHSMVMRLHFENSSEEGSQKRMNQKLTKVMYFNWPLVP